MKDHYQNQDVNQSNQLSPDIEKVINTTKSQSEIWTSCYFGGDDANRNFNLLHTVAFDGLLNSQAMELAIQTVVNRHDSLRATFSADGIQMCIFKQRPITINIRDLSNIEKEFQNDVIENYTSEESSFVFDLANGPLFRASLIKFSNKKHYLILNIHHIVCDGWSIGIILKELGIIYSALVENKSPELPETISFSDYAEEEQSFSNSDEYKEVEKYWFSLYEQSVPVVDLPTDNPRPMLRTYKSENLNFLLDSLLVESIQKIGFNAGTSLNTIMLAGFEVFLHQLTGQNDIVVGLPAAGQPVTGMSELVGHCVNLLPLRSNPEPNSSFIDYLNKRKLELFDAYDNQQLSFGHLIQKLNIARDPSRVPLVPIVFNIDIGMTDGVQFSNLTYKLISNPTDFEVFEIAINASGNAEKLIFEWSYNVALFKPETIKKMMMSFEQVLQNIVENPIQTIEEISVQYNNIEDSKKSEQCTDVSYSESFSAQTDVPSRYKTYWINKLSGQLSTVSLPTIKSRPNVKANKGEGYRFFFSKSETDILHNFVSANEGDLFACLLAAWNILFYNYTSQQDIILGTSLTEKNDEYVENQNSYYSNSVVLRTAIDPTENFSVFYNKIRKTQLLDYQNQPYFMDQLIADMAIISDPSRNAIFDIMVNFDKTEKKILNNNLNAENNPSNLGHKTVKYDIEITFNETGGTLFFDIIYDTEVYEASMIKNLILHFKTLLYALIEKPTATIDEINYISDQERDLILNVFNKPKVDYPKNKTIVDLFLEQVVKTPNAIAVVNNDEKLTYKDLDILSNQLANYLIEKHNIVTGDLVAILLERSEWQIVSIIGILKAGAVYVPIDTAYPQERIIYIQNDSKCKLMIDSSAIDNFHITRKDYSITLPPSIVNLKFNNLSYIIYTSGTTGNPKGVMIIHEAVVNLIAHQTKLFNINQDEKIGQFSSYCFDASVEVIFLALLNGCSLYIISEETLKNHLLLSFLENNDITHLDATPSYLETLPEISHLRKLRRIIAGGESCSIKLAKKLGETCDFYNAYGPTENTVTSTVYKYSTDDNIKSLLPIGKPIGNTCAYILSPSQKLQGIGISGELYLSGIGLSKGYLNRPELTAEKFIQNPFIPNSKMYRTGDIARWDANGNIEFIGRTDDQVKIRGYRIELGEIEKNLESIENVKTAVVLAHNDRLIAYVLQEHYVDVGTNKIKEWKNYLASKLPEYFVPYDFKILKELPTTSNGKLDKKALLKIESENNSTRTCYTAPRTKEEKLVATVWEEILNIDNIDICSNFFEIGGHSLVAVRVMNKIEQQTAKKLPLSALFEHSTIEQLAKLLSVDIEIYSDYVVPIKPQGSKPPLFIVHGAGLNVLNFKHIAHHFDIEQPVYGIQGIGPNGYDNWFQSIEDMAACYNESIIKINPNGPYALAGFSFGGIVAFEMARQLKEQGKIVSIIALLDSSIDSSFYYASPWQKKLARYYNLTYKRLDYLIEMLTSWKAFKMRSQAKKEYILKRYFGQKDFITEQEAEALEEFTRANSMAQVIVDRYHLKPQNLEVDLFRAMDETEDYRIDPMHLGWKKAALKGVIIHNIAGKHLDIVDPPNDKVLARMIQDILDERHAKT